MVAGKRVQRKEHRSSSKRRRQGILDERAGKPAKGSTRRSTGGKPSKPMKPS